MTSPDIIEWRVEGMTCSNCALTINKYLQSKGVKNIYVNAIGGEVSFESYDKAIPQKLAEGIGALGYKVNAVIPDRGAKNKTLFENHFQRFCFCLPFTILLMAHMVPGVHLHFLMHPFVQFLLTLPVYITGMYFFGKSAIKSISNGLLNMNVLVASGSSLAFFYSLAGSLFVYGSPTLFYETTASIITFVFFGNYLEEASLKKTQGALDKLVRAQKITANMIAFDHEHKEHIFPIENTQLKAGDLVLIRSGEQVPLDAKILWGEAWVNESILSGESLPILKKQKDFLIGGSILEEGNVKAQIIAAGKDTVLSNILNLVKKAQGEKPPVQKMADRVSAVFVPAVLFISFTALVLNCIILKQFTPSLLRAISVLVIACPCAMGLATPAAIAVGLGRAAKNGILFRNAKSLELFKNVKQIVFDKTGTLTTGRFITTSIHVINGISDQEFKDIVYNLEKYSTHPIAKTIVHQWKTKNEVRWKKIEEVKGLGIKAIDGSENVYLIGSHKIASINTNEKNHTAYVLKNGELLGWIDMQDELRPESQEIIDYFKSKHIRTILLSGDRAKKCQQIAQELKIDEVVADQSPVQKLQKIKALSLISPTIMVGDGVNDSPALAAATIGISLSDASQMAMQSADIVLMNSGLKKLPLAFGIGTQTYMTIKENLWWAFSYNMIMIPMAAIGWLGTHGPIYSALLMGLSDVILILNSVLLFVKKIRT
ncbi:MAG: heavy metal translocating P-type ATPase [Flavisolibacter sp.]